MSREKILIKLKELLKLKEIEVLYIEQLRNLKFSWHDKIETNKGIFRLIPDSKIEKIYLEGITENISESIGYWLPDFVVIDRDATINNYRSNETYEDHFTGYKFRRETIHENWFRLFRIK